MGRAVTELSTHTFELDLTSVCVSSGTIQLPLKMLPYFTPGRIPAVVDGQAVELEFEAPRRLMGLRQLFAERGLRSNDRVRFELELDGDRVVGLRATCIRRERPKAPEAPAPKEAGKASHAHRGARAAQQRPRPFRARGGRRPRRGARGHVHQARAAEGPRGPGAEGGG